MASQIRFTLAPVVTTIALERSLLRVRRFVPDQTVTLRKLRATFIAFVGFDSVVNQFVLSQVGL